MIKTEQEIERDFYKLVKDSSLGKAIKGAVYRSEMRPMDSREEDIILTFVGGIDRQIQRGTVQVDIFVSDLSYKDGRSVPDKQRISVLQGLLLEFVSSYRGEYRLTMETSPQTANAEGIHQHFIYSRIDFKRLSE